MYFGVISKLKEENLNDERVQEYLKGKGVLERVVKRVSTTLNYSPIPKKQSFFERFKIAYSNLKNRGLNNSKYRYQEKKVLLNLNDAVIHKYYSTSFKKEVYYYITNLFEGIINVKFQLLSDSLNKDIEVHIDKLKIDEVIKVLFIETFRGLVDESSSGSSVVSNVDKLPEQKTYFSQLKEEQTQIINQIEKYPLLIDCYLEGNEDLIMEELLSSCKIIQDIIDFDFNYKFLLALNKKYTIEEASKDIIDEKFFKILSEFPKVFTSVDVVVFTFNKIESLVEFLPAHIISLYFALFKRDLVFKNKTEYQRYVFEVHGIEFAHIRKEKIQDATTPHKKRVNQFLEEIDAHFPPKSR